MADGNLLEPGPDPVVESPWAPHAAFIDRGYTLLNLIAGDVNQIIGVVTAALIVSRA